MITYEAKTTFKQNNGEGIATVTFSTRMSMADLWGYDKFTDIMKEAVEEKFGSISEFEVEEIKEVIGKD
jgi:hypothetical protein